MTEINLEEEVEGKMLKVRVGPWFFFVGAAKEDE